MIQSTMHLTFLASAAFVAAASVGATGRAMQTTTQDSVDGDVLVVACQGDGTIHLVDAAQGRTLAVIPTAPAPHEVATTRDGRWAVVSNYVTPGSPPGHTLQVIDVAARRVARVIDLGRYTAPHDLKFLPGDSVLAATSEATGRVVLVNFARGEVKAALPTGGRGSHMLAVSPDGRRVYTANVHDGHATEIDVASGTVTRRFAHASRTEGIALTPDGRQLWLASLAEGTTAVFSTETGERLATVPTPGHPYRVAFTPDGAKALIPAPQEDLLRVVDVATRRVETIDVPGGPGGPVAAPDGRTVYLPLLGTAQVGVVDLVEKRVVRTLPAGAGPDGIGIARGG
jgi:DNA-binding beta-propeller fold protein YncE